MYKITWDKETGGVLLHSRIVDGTLGISPRPVFWEELDLLKLNELGWKYPHAEEPLLWAVNKQYWYQGELMFEAKGANIYDPATIIFRPGKEKVELKPVNVKKMLERNADFMFLLESEAIEFIRETFIQYAGARRSVAEVKANQLDYEALAKHMEAKTKKKMAIVREDCDSFEIMPLDTAEDQGKKVFHTTKIDKFIASFSGGKDSQVVLDLCTRAIPSTEFEVIYSDTGYELPPSLELYQQVQAHYHQHFPNLKFSLTRNHESVLNYWDKIGTPSDKHRWCCSIMKTAPLYRSLKIEGTNKQAKVLTFDGVRAEESVRRANYNRIGKGVKHQTVINARPILHWNMVEIFLYLLKYHLPINPAYRLGKARVGCVICPFSTTWDDMIVNQHYPKSLAPFLNRLERLSVSSGVKDIQDYIKERKWKFRASGNILGKSSSVSFENKGSDFIARIKDPQLDILTWLPVLCPYSVYTKSDSECMGELNFEKKLYSFSISKSKKGFYFIIHNATNPNLQSLTRRVIYKATYCISCETCEVECPTGALKVLPSVQIDKKKCIHCHKCLNFHEKGCVVATSVSTTVNSNMKKKSGIDRYNTFGLREEWLSIFFSDPESFFIENIAGLGVKQIPAMANWLKEAEIINDKKELTEIGKILSQAYVNDPDIVWEILWVNIVRNSFIANWFCSRVKPNSQYNKKLLTDMFMDEFQSAYGKRTVENAIAALVATFSKSPIGERFGLCVDEKKGTAYRRNSIELSDLTVAYSTYRYAEEHNTKSLRVNDFYGENNMGGVFVEFGFTKESAKKSFRNLDSASNRVLIAELNMGLDCITLREDLNALSCLKALVMS